MNDLIGLRYGWGHAPWDGSGKTDCFQLACEVHKRLGFADYTEQFEWVYRDYTDETFPRKLILRWLLDNGTRIDAPRHGAVAFLLGEAGAALATVLENDAVLFIAPSQNVVRSQIPAGTGAYFWMNR
jgi:hypothetical protein